MPGFYLAVTVPKSCNRTPQPLSAPGTRVRQGRRKAPAVTGRGISLVRWRSIFPKYVAGHFEREEQKGCRDASWGDGPVAAWRPPVGLKRAPSETNKFSSKTGLIWLGHCRRRGADGLHRHRVDGLPCRLPLSHCHEYGSIPSLPSRAAPSAGAGSATVTARGSSALPPLRPAQLGSERLKPA